MKAKTVIQYVKLLEAKLTRHLGHKVKLTHNNIEDYRIEIFKCYLLKDHLRRVGYGETIFRNIKKYLSIKNNYYEILGNLRPELFGSQRTFDIHFNDKLIERDKKSCYFEKKDTLSLKKNLTKVA